MMMLIKNNNNFWATVYKTVRPMLWDRCPVCLSVPSVLSLTLVYCGQRVGCIKMKLGMEVGLGQATLCWIPSSPPQQKGHSPQFLVHVHCGQTAGWIKMPLGMEVGLGPCDFVLDGDPAPPKKGAQAQPPNFWPIHIVAKQLDGSRCHLVQR